MRSSWLADGYLLAVSSVGERERETDTERETERERASSLVSLLIRALTSIKRTPPS